MPLKAVLSIWLCTLSLVVQAQSIEIGGGVIEEQDGDHVTLFQLATLSDPIQPLVGIQLHAGLLLAAEQTGYLHAGLNKTFELPGRWSWGVSLSAGYYETDNPELELGHEVEFMSRLQLDYELSSDQTLRLEVGHLSNANIGDENPGTEFLLLNWMLRL